MTPAQDARSGLRPQQGDEAELFERYNRSLIRATAGRVNTSPANVADACAYAWHQLLVYQPRRETVFAWLGTVARREAVRLEGVERRVAGDFALAAETKEDPKDNIGARAALVDVRRHLRPLKPQQQAALLLTALGWTYEEAAQRLGVTKQRVGQILVASRETLRQREEARRMHDAVRNGDAPPRVRLLAELQRDPPPFLRAVIGRPPEGTTFRGGAKLRLDWASVALAIVDHRVAHGITDPARPFGSPDRHPGPPDELVERIDDLNARRRATRHHSRGLDL